MDCSELIELYNKVGGTLICNYQNKKVIVLETILSCDIKPKDYKPLEELAHTFAFSPYELTHMKQSNYKIDDIINSNIKIMNRYLNNDEIGYKIVYK